MKIDILVLNYNGGELLEKFLPSACEAAKNSLHQCTVYVIDNRSTDNSRKILEKKFPDARLYASQENKVLCSYNDIVKLLDSEVVIFLNNDMKASPDFIDHLAGHFQDQSVMFVAPRINNFDGTYNGGRSRILFGGGVIKVVVEQDKALEPGETQAISTGAFRRSMFISLGGFDDLYLPGIWEDVDLCFRGLKRGWKGVYEPKAVIWHDESTTFHREYGKRGKMIIAHRNMFLFFWKNISDPEMFVLHIIFIPARLVLQYFTGNSEPLKGFISTFWKIPQVIKKRRYMRLEKAGWVLKDRDIIN